MISFLKSITSQKGVGTWPVKIKTGTESEYAVVIPVIVFVAAGPDVHKIIPGNPLARENPSAMCVAACSCLVKTWVIFFEYDGITS